MQIKKQYMYNAWEQEMRGRRRLTSQIPSLPTCIGISALPGRYQAVKGYRELSSQCALVLEPIPIPTPHSVGCGGPIFPSLHQDLCGFGVIFSSEVT